MPKTAAVIVAAGSGTRFGGEKQLIELEGKPLFQWSIEAFRSVNEIEAIILVASEGLRSVISDNSIHVISGGASRQDSVHNGVTKANDLGCEIVLVHDAARCLVTPELIARILDVTIKHGAAIAAVPVVDTIKEVNGDVILRTVQRAKLWRAQTPQGGRVTDLLRAYEQSSGEAFTDEAELLESIGVQARIVEGSEDNFKITFPVDLDRARDVMRRRRAES